MSQVAPEHKDGRDRLLTYGDVADYLRWSPEHVRKLVSRGEIPHLKLGKSVRFRRSEIERWIDERDASAA